MELQGYDKFLKLRRYVLDALDDGTFDLILTYPDYFYDEPEFVKITLHCFSLGPDKRNFNWFGKTLGEVVDNCYRDVSQWIKEEQEADYES